MPSFGFDTVRASTIARQIRRSGYVEALYQVCGRQRVLSLPQINLHLPINPDDIFVDCGANVGQTASMFARTGAMVYAFEPNPICADILRNRFKFTPNVDVRHAGVMNRACDLILRVPKQTQHMHWETSVEGSFVEDGVDTPEHYDSYTVPCVDLSDWVLGQTKSIALLKLDIEGAEVDVINHLIDTKAIGRIGLLACETHESKSSTLKTATDALRARVQREGLNDRVRFDWP
jgi:FkbM family methyltransferase